MSDSTEPFVRIRGLEKHFPIREGILKRQVGSVKAVADIAHNLQLVELTITPGSPMRGYSLSELELPADSRVLAFGKDGDQLQLPDADASLEVGDRVVAIADFGVLREVEQIIVGESGRALAQGGA